ncbi:hypothetical protein ACLEX4_15755 [Pseudescherichia vulneris]
MMGLKKLNSEYDKISNIRKPVFVMENKSAIDVLIHHEDFGDIMFTAAAYDTEQHGRMLWQELMDGVHGQIAEFDVDAFNQRISNLKKYQDEEKYSALLRLSNDIQLQYVNKKILSERGLFDSLTEVEEEELTEIELFSAQLLSVRPQLGNETVNWPTLPTVLQNKK